MSLTTGPIDPTAAALPTAPATPPERATARAAAERFEASFLAEMLRHSGLASPPEVFGGGPGEARFASMLVAQYAEQIAAQTDLGIAERVEAALIARSGR